MSEDSDDECRMLAINNRKERAVALFKTFMLNEEYNTAINFTSDSFGYAPTPFVINEIIFKIIISCEEKLAYKAADYLECSLRVMSAHEDQKSNFIKALQDPSGTKQDIWDAFSHFVWSNIHYLKVAKAHSHKEYVKSPNCDLLVDIYVKAFLKSSIKSDILGSRVEQRFSSLLKWISLYYKNNYANEPILSSLHNLLDYIVDSEISSDQSLPLCVRMHTANLSQYMFLILNICKDVFASPEKQQRFFIYSMSHYLMTKLCQYRLHELIDEKSLPRNPGMVTLKSIVDNYFFGPEKKSLRKSDSPRRSSRVKLKKFSKDPIPGDTNFHEQCRLGRPADLLCALYSEKTKDINMKNSAGNTPLHEACLASSYLCCKFLIEETDDRKVDYRATENGGRTPLHCAVYVDAVDIVKLLLNRGGNDLIKLEDSYGKKPIDYSISNNMKRLLQEIESKLEENGAQKSPESYISKQLRLPNLKNAADFLLYLKTLKSFVSNYCEIYELPKTNAKTLSHNSKECYHYKADSETLCTEDSSTLDTFNEVIKKFISCAKLASKEECVEKELERWKRFEAIFK